MKHIIKFGITVALTLLQTVSANSQVTICKTNPHYLFYKEKPIIIVTSDHHYGAVIDSDFNFVKYINYLGDNGMNLTRIYPGGMFEPPDKYQRGNPLGPLPGRQILPWMKSNQPGANKMLAEKGKPSYKFDLDKWNPEYFSRLKAFVSLAGEKNIIVEIAFFNGMYSDCWPLMAMYHNNNIQNIGHYESEDCGLFTTTDIRNQDVIKYQKEYIKKIVVELNEYDNLIFDICDEPSLQGLEDGSITIRKDSIITPWINVMKDVFIQTEQSLPKKHLLGQTVQNLSPDLSDQKWCMWLPTEYVTPAERALKLDYKRNKPIIDVETNFFGMSLTKSPYSAEAVRLEGWWFILGGGAGVINLNGEYYRGNESGGEITRKQIVPQKIILNDFIKSLDLNGLSSFTNYNVTHEGTSSKGLGEKGKQYAIYLFHAKPDNEWGCSFIPDPGSYIDTLLVKDVPAASYLVGWIDPATGILKGPEKIEWHGGNMKFITPAYSLDVVFWMRNQK